jgi:hypothetical protein
MKKRPILSALLAAAVALLTFVSASAQEQLVSFDERESAQPVRVKRPSVVRLEAMKADMSALEKRKTSLRAYIANTDPGSAEYQAAQRSLVELEVKLQDMARDIVRLGAAVGTEPAVAAPAPFRATLAPVRAMPAPDAPAPAATAEGDPAAALQTDSLAASIATADRGGAEIDIDIARFPGSEVQVEARNSAGTSLSKERYVIGTPERRAGGFRVSVPIAASGATTVIVTSLDSGAPTAPVAVTIPEPARPAAVAPRRAPATRPARLVGLLLGGTVISQQAENLSQADPFMGFIVGYDDMPDTTDPNYDPKKDNDWRAHWRVQSIFQVQPKTEEAPVEGTGEGEDTDNNGAADPPDFRSFIASRKSFDVEMSFWYDRPATKWLIFGNGNTDPNIRLGFYGAVGGTAYVSKNELKGDESVKVEDTKDANNNDNTNDQVELDVERAKVDNDIDLFYEGGLIGNFFKGMEEGKPKLFMQVKLGYGRYEALAGFNPGKTGFFNDSRNRFVGKLRIFPMFLDRDPEGTADASPMLGVEINAGRGPDQIKFFTGIATAFKLLKK